MDYMKSFLDTIRYKASKRILYSQHALRQISRSDRMILTAEIRMVLDNGEIIEDYPEDPRGHSSLLLGKDTSERPIHVLCAPKDEYLAIITVYLPNEEEWTNNYKMRKTS